MKTLSKHFMKNKYIISFKSGFQQQLLEKEQIVGRLIIYSFITLLFSQICKGAGASAIQFLYYAMTQVICLSTSLVAFQIAQDMQDEQFSQFLLRPINYLLYRLCESMGISVLRYITLFAIYLLLTYCTLGKLTYHCFFGAILGIMGVFLNTLLSLLIGLFSFWIKEIKSIFYLNMTATFCYGGLIVPIELYTSHMRIISFCTPYPWVLWWPAQYVVRESSLFLYSIFGWLFWNLILGMLILYFYKKCLRLFVLGTR